MRVLVFIFWACHSHRPCLVTVVFLVSKWVCKAHILAFEDQLRFGWSLQMLALSSSLIDFCWQVNLMMGRRLRSKLLGNWNGRWIYVNLTEESKVVVDVTTKWGGGLDAITYLVCAIWCWPRCASMFSFTTYWYNQRLRLGTGTRAPRVSSTSSILGFQPDSILLD